MENTYTGVPPPAVLDIKYLLLAIYKAAKKAQPLNIHSEDGNCNVCQNGFFNIQQSSSLKAKVVQVDFCFILLCFYAVIQVKHTKQKRRLSRQNDNT
jgi:hypothetical protein